MLIGKLPTKPGVYLLALQGSMRIELRRKLNVNSDTTGIPPSQDALRNERRASKEKGPTDGKGTPSDASKGEMESSIGARRGILATDIAWFSRMR